VARSKKITARIDKVIADIEASGLKYGVGEPHEFLAEIYAGRDPRYDTSPLYDLISTIALDKRMPTEEEWQDLKQLVLEDPVYRYTRVSLSMAMDAAKTLLPYTVPKMKAIEIDAGKEEEHKQAPEMTPAEIRRMKMELADDDSF
jgi:hypothetical protein